MAHDIERFAYIDSFVSKCAVECLPCRLYRINEV